MSILPKISSILRSPNIWTRYSAPTRKGHTTSSFQWKNTSHKHVALNTRTTINILSNSICPCIKGFCYTWDPTFLRITFMTTILLKKNPFFFRPTKPVLKTWQKLVILNQYFICFIEKPDLSFTYIDSKTEWKIDLHLNTHCYLFVDKH